MELYVTDTHSLIWYLIDSPKLGLDANKCFERVEKGKAKLLIPAIVIAEIIFILESGKVKADLEEIFKRIEEAENFDISPLGVKQLRCLKEQIKISEMHDRLIVCETLIHNAKLVTKDNEIKEAGIVKVIW